MGSPVGVGALSSCFSGSGSQREALARGHSRWSVWEPVFVYLYLGRYRSGMGSDLYLAPGPSIASICQDLTPYEDFQVSSGLRPGLETPEVIWKGTLVRGSWGEGLRL